MLTPPKSTDAGMAHGGTTAWPGTMAALENMVVPHGLRAARGEQGRAACQQLNSRAGPSTARICCTMQR